MLTKGKEKKEELAAMMLINSPTCVLKNRFNRKIKFRKMRI